MTKLSRTGFVVRLCRLTAHLPVATRLLMALGDLVIGWLLARQAEVALAALDGQDAGLSDRDRAFYQGKLATSRFFAQTVLPRLTVERRAVEETTLELMELPEEAF